MSLTRVLLHPVNLTRHALRDHHHGIPRSPHWHTAKEHFLQSNPTCAGCGGTTRLQVHHIRPFHLDPQLELADGTGTWVQLKNPDGTLVCNFIVLCMGLPECHLHLGHGGDFKCANLNVVQDAADALQARARGLPVETIESRARLVRVAALPARP